MRTRGPLRARSERGASAVEFGLIVIPLFILLIGIIQFSLWLWAYQVGAHAAREGARVAAVNPCNAAAIQARATDRVGSAADGTVTVTPDSGAFDVGDSITVEVEFKPHTIGLFTMPNVDKTATARVEYIPEGSC